jgi:hypothetical protein
MQKCFVLKEVKVPPYFLFIVKNLTFITNELHIVLYGKTRKYHN